jgi:hypothetical protein
METERTEENERETAAPTDLEWGNRVLCSDGNCIGVIGPDGRQVLDVEPQSLVGL